MKTTQKLLAFLLACSLLLGCFVTSALAQKEDIAGLIAAIPTDFESIKTVDDSRYDAAFKAAETAVLEIAEHSDDEIVQMENYEKAFDAYCYLYALNCKSQIPGNTINAENWQNAFSAMMEANEFVKTSEFLGRLALYTSQMEDPDDPEMVTSYGMTQLGELAEAWMMLVTRVTGYMVNLPEADQLAMDSAAFTLMLDRLPDTLTVENVIASIDDLLLIQSTYEEEYNTPEARAHLKPEDVQRYNQYMTTLNTIKNGQKSVLIQQAAAAIAKYCRIEAVTDISQAKAAFAFMTDYLQVSSIMDGLAAMYSDDETILEQVPKYDVYCEYEELLFQNDTIVYGDLNDDYYVDATDALIVLKIAVGKEEGSLEQLVCGDVNDDGDVNATDALLILQFAVGKIDIFPVEENLYFKD